MLKRGGRCVGEQHVVEVDLVARHGDVVGRGVPGEVDLGRRQRDRGQPGGDGGGLGVGRGQRRRGGRS